MIYRDVYAEIDLKAIEHNYREICKHIQPTAKFCAVVKANAYGHGAVEISKIAVKCGADFLAVATVDEAIELRKNNFTLPILILGLIPANAIEIAVENNITLTVCDYEFAKRISDISADKNILAKVHLKVETGMGRIGIDSENAIDCAVKISKLKNVELEGIFSHFADADSADKSFTHRQLEIFLDICKKVTELGVNIKIRHIAESAAILEMPETHLDMVRAGISSYGFYPSAEVKHTIILKPAMKLIARAVFIKKISAGTSIGYGRDFIAQRDSVIATLPIGYADGYIRAYKNFHVEVHGKLAPIAGRICMDQFMVDITDIENVKVGDEFILFGSDKITVDDAAEYLNTINYEVTCLISERVPRIYIN